MSGDTAHTIRALQRLAEEHPEWADLLRVAIDDLYGYQGAEQYHEAQANQRISYLMNNLRRLLEQVGKRARCKACGKEIWYVQLRSGMVGPYQADGLNHGAAPPDLDKGAAPCGSSSSQRPGRAPSED